jgi:hypothetical protein
MHIAQYFCLTNLVISKILETGFATVLVHYQVQLILLQCVCIPAHAQWYDIL